uniref:Uncharacterized protein n=1 Tax=Chrysemys picta bellii TaxID=8478 RepID=A0A8C3HLP9_CHRPI
RAPPTPTAPCPRVTQHRTIPASVLGSCLQPAPAQTPVTIVLTPPSPVVGGGVSLAPQPPPQDLLTCNWYRSATVTDPNSLILTYVQYPNPAQNNGPAHTGRETAGPGCALNMAGLMLNYTGNYTVQIQSSTAANPVRSTVVLRVSGKCHPGSCADPICAPPPTAIPTLTLDPGSRNDSGSSTCLATNAASSQNATVRLDVLWKLGQRSGVQGAGDGGSVRHKDKRGAGVCGSRESNPSGQRGARPRSRELQ